MPVTKVPQFPLFTGDFSTRNLPCSKLVLSLFVHLDYLLFLPLPCLHVMTGAPSPCYMHEYEIFHVQKGLNPVYSLRIPPTTIATVTGGGHYPQTLAAMDVLHRACDNYYNNNPVGTIKKIRAACTRFNMLLLPRKSIVFELHTLI